jgi:hypothetical protein
MLAHILFDLPCAGHALRKDDKIALAYLDRPPSGVTTTSPSRK